MLTKVSIHSAQRWYRWHSWPAEAQKTSAFALCVRGMAWQTTLALNGS
jgi:hypothetical protein